jgi:inositol transport system ATP-binding protein
MSIKTDANSIFVLQMEGISKAFSGVTALDNVSLNIKQGEVHALMGENGAGKSTLMKILTGIYEKDGGTILLKSQPVTIKNPKEAIKQGISMIHQELNHVENMSVSENIFLGKEPCYKFLNIVNTKEQRKQTLLLFKEMGITINPDAKMQDLSVAQMQMVEIVKAVSYNSDIIIMDEPTSAITDKEVEKLFEIIRNLKAKGIAIIYISHKMDEIFRISDTITILRDGCFVSSLPVAILNNDLLIKLMVGREISEIFPEVGIQKGEALLKVEGLTKEGMFSNISFELHKGEILGLSGLMGAGRTEVGEAIFGMHRINSGKILINNREVNIKSPADAIKNKIALISEDRKLKGLNLKGSVKDNISLVTLKQLCRLSFIMNSGKENFFVDSEIQKFNIKTSGRNRVIDTLSGGNQQKAVLSKWLSTDPDILILDEPTRGIDVGAKTEIYKLINELAKKGKAILLISSELPEILGLGLNFNVKIIIRKK